MKRIEFMAGIALLCFMAVSLIACGGGSDRASSGSTGGVSGVAASGKAIANAAVTLVDSKGKTASGTTGADGSFTISSAGLTPPFMLKVVAGSRPSTA